MLVTVSTFRQIFGFLLNFQVTTWIREKGYFGAFSIYSGIIAGVALLMPLIFLYGKRIRLWSAGRLERTGKAASKIESDDEQERRNLGPNASFSSSYLEDRSTAYTPLHPAMGDNSRFVDSEQAPRHMARTSRAS